MFGVIGGNGADLETIRAPWPVVWPAGRFWVSRAPGFDLRLRATQPPACVPHQDNGQGGTIPQTAMATGVGPKQVSELFYSYSGKDAELRDQLDRHLSMLKRSGIIEGWYDRNITAGREWAGQIDEHLNRADVILLLISADFLASDDCYAIEMKRALERHAAGEAVVIPIILRPVDWTGAPFAKLQCLPTRAVPVTSWADRDEALRDVAEGIRRAVVRARRPPETEVQERALDAAIPSRVPVGESADLLVMIRRTASAGLKSVLRVDQSYQVSEDDVCSKVFRMDFARNDGGELQPHVLTIRIETADFDVTSPTKQIPVPPDGDSDTCVFLVVAKRAGRLQLNVEVLHDGVTVASHLLRATGDQWFQADLPVAYVLASLPLTVYAHQAIPPFTRMFQEFGAGPPSPKPEHGEFTRLFKSGSVPSRASAGEHTVVVCPPAQAAGASGVFSGPAPAPAPQAAEITGEFETVKYPAGSSPAVGAARAAGVTWTRTALLAAVAVVIIGLAAFVIYLAR